jgi:hypothetical protein
MRKGYARPVRTVLQDEQLSLFQVERPPLQESHQATSVYSPSADDKAAPFCPSSSRYVSRCRKLDSARVPLTSMHYELSMAESSALARALALERAALCFSPCRVEVRTHRWASVVIYMGASTSISQLVIAGGTQSTMSSFGSFADLRPPVTAPYSRSLSSSGLVLGRANCHLSWVRHC